MAHEGTNRHNTGKLSDNRKVTMRGMLDYLLEAHGVKRERRTVYRWIIEKRFPTAGKVGREWYFWTAEVDSFLERNPP